MDATTPDSGYSQCCGRARQVFSDHRKWLWCSAASGASCDSHDWLTLLDAVSHDEHTSYVNASLKRVPCAAVNAGHCDCIPPMLSSHHLHSHHTWLLGLHSGRIVDCTPSILSVNTIVQHAEQQPGFQTYMRVLPASTCITTSLRTTVQYALSHLRLM